MTDDKTPGNALALPGVSCLYRLKQPLSAHSCTIISCFPLLYHTSVIGSDGMTAGLPRQNKSLMFIERKSSALMPPSPTMNDD